MGDKGHGSDRVLTDKRAYCISKGYRCLSEGGSSLPRAEPRFIMLEMILEYARERLKASSEEATMRRRHAVYFVELAEHAEPELRLAGRVMIVGLSDSNWIWKICV